MKTFTFRYDPNASVNSMFNDFEQAIKTKKKEIHSDEIISQSIEAILSSMTKTRLDLFYCIANEKPVSLYQLAQILNRDQANVLRDAKALEEIGVIELKNIQDGNREKLTPVALYDRIVFDFGEASKTVKTTPSFRKMKKKKHQDHAA